MFTPLMRAALAMVVALPSIVCAQQSSSAPPPPPAAGDTAARVGDRVITVREVDEAWQRADPSGQMRATQSLYEGRKRALDTMIGDMLIAEAAEARGVTAEQYLLEEMSKRQKPITDAEVGAFYEQNRSQMQGRTLAEIGGRIRSFLEMQQKETLREAVVAELRKSAPPIRVALDPPRQPIDVLASDPSRGPADAPVVLVEFSDYQ